MLNPAHTTVGPAGADALEKRKNVAFAVSDMYPAHAIRRRADGLHSLPPPRRLPLCPLLARPARFLPPVGHGLTNPHRLISQPQHLALAGLDG
jgi:hypothetical protein